MGLFINVVQKEKEKELERIWGYGIWDMTAMAKGLYIKCQPSSSLRKKITSVLRISRTFGRSVCFGAYTFLCACINDVDPNCARNREFMSVL